MKLCLSQLSQTFFAASACLSINAFAAEALPTPEPAKITVDVPVTLKTANVVFNMDHIALGGDMPFGMKYMDLLSKKMKADQATGKIIGVFHGPGAFMTLNDVSYNSNRHVTTGNPYKGLINELVAEGVQIEECAESMKGNGWTNKDLLPAVKVNTGAVGRIVELTQQGFVQIQP